MYILSKIQWGFWKVFSVHHCLLLLLEKYRNDLDKGDFSGITMTDLLKAFDCIDHQLSIPKLNAYGFKIESPEFINSYLSKTKSQIKSSLTQWLIF